MTKFHINKNGIPAPCKAKTGNCPLGGSETHFKTQEEAQAYSDKLSQSKHGLLPSVDKNEVKYSNRIEKLEESMLKDKIKFNRGNPTGPGEFSATPVEEKLEEYFVAAIRKHKGENIDLNEFEYDWSKEVEDEKEVYMDSSSAYHNFENGGGQEEEWSDYSEKVFNEELQAAEEVNEFYGERKEFINHIVNKVTEVDWTKYGKTQKQGEIEALEVISEGELAYE